MSLSGFFILYQQSAPTNIKIVPLSYIWILFIQFWYEFSVPLSPLVSSPGSPDLPLSLSKVFFHPELPLTLNLSGALYSFTSSNRVINPLLYWYCPPGVGPKKELPFSWLLLRTPWSVKVIGSTERPFPTSNLCKVQDGKNFENVLLKFIHRFNFLTMLLMGMWVVGWN